MQINQTHLPTLAKNSSLVLLGMLLVIFLETSLPAIAIFLCKNSYKEVFLRCQLGYLHAKQFGGVDQGSELNNELHKTILVELLSCDEYQNLKNKLMSYDVSQPKLKLLEVDAINQEPELISSMTTGLPSR